MAFVTLMVSLYEGGFQINSNEDLSNEIYLILSRIWSTNDRGLFFFARPIKEFEGTFVRGVTLKQGSALR
jgi:hypothetical protein